MARIRKYYQKLYSPKALRKTYSALDKYATYKNNSTRLKLETVARYFLKAFTTTHPSSTPPNRSHVGHRSDARFESHVNQHQNHHTIGIEIMRLCKQFGDKTSVNNLNLKLYDGQITVRFF